MSKTDAYDRVTDRIIEALEGGHIPWSKPWRSVAGAAPTSLQTGKPYRGINVWILSLESALQGFTSPYWVTFKQAKQRGGNVRKGEQGTQVVLWKPVTKTVEENGEQQDKKFLLLRTFTVFNADQCEGLDLPEEEALPERDPIMEAEAIVSGFLNRPEIRHGGNQAFYRPALDYVQMPEMGQFTDSESYYHTLFHELAHSTGHESRLKRDTLIAPAPFGSEDYSKEELVAEMAAAFLSAEAGLEVEVEHSAGYIQNWLKALKDDRKLLVNAAAKAQKASDHILAVEKVSTPQTAPESLTEAPVAA